MVAAFDYCLHGRGGAAPSIDTAMHGLVDATHVDHLHPDSGIALRDRGRRRDAHRRLLRRTGSPGCRGDVPGSSSAWTSPRSRSGTRTRSARSSAGTGSPPGATRPTSARRARSRSSGRPSAFIVDHGRAEPFGPLLAGYGPLPEAERHARAAALLPIIRGLASTDRPQVGHYTDSEVVLDFLARVGASPARRARDLVPGPLPADEGPAARARPAADRAARRGHRPAQGAPRRLPRGLRGVLRAPRRRRAARRCAARTRRSSWSRASGCSASGRTSRPPASPASSTSTPST